uniref:Putative zinc finger, DNL-type, Mitochondrial import protein TIM15 n=1 Tax=Helianthus annuus TaxID=4232 RepID=A0A251S2F7_HELAN
MATTASSLFSLPTTTPKPHKTTTLFSCPNFLKPKFTLKFPRYIFFFTYHFLGFAVFIGGFLFKRKEKGSKKVSPFVISCLVDDNLNAEGSFGDAESNPRATIDLKLPRRSLLVQFTCNACGVRSQKLINRLAYEKGMVFVQCTGCEQYHKLVDNLNLVVEYDFREEINASPDADQV